jgi:hypothetical protein
MQVSESDAFVEYTGNLNIRYVMAMTIQLHSNIFQVAHEYVTDQDNGLIMVNHNRL